MTDSPTDKMKTGDKHGLLLLIATSLIWISSCGYVISDGLHPAPLSINETQIENSGFKQYFINKRWLFDTLTYEYPPCNNQFHCYPDTFFGFTYFCGFYNFFIILLFIWVLLETITRFLDCERCITFYTYLIVIATSFIAVSVLYRIALYTVSDLIPRQICYKSFVFWWLPECILCLLILIAVICMRRANSSYTRKVLKRTFRWCFKMYCAILLAVFFVVVIILIEIITTLLIADLEWTNILLYTIVGGSCYIAFFIYNVGYAIVTVVIWHMIEGSKDPIKTVLRATILVSRFHLGSIACYSSIFLPLIVAWREKSNLTKTFVDNSDKTLGVRVKSGMELSEEEPNVELLYYESWRLSLHNRVHRDIMPAIRYLRNHYVIQIFKSSLIFVVVRGLSFRDSTKIILLRHSLNQKLPNSTVFWVGWPYVYLLLCIIHETSQSLLRLFQIEFYNAPYFDFISVVAYSKIAAVMFLLGIMLINNFELTTETYEIEHNERCQITDEKCQKTDEH